MQIEEPIVLARLPKSLHEDNAHKFGPVYGFTRGNKKKRNEISVAVDGNSVNVYEVQDGNIRASYAVPPDSYFTCRPSSVRIKTSKHTYSRYTYISTNRRNHVELDCFQERFEKDQSQGVPSSVSLLSGEYSHIAYIDILPELNSTTANDMQHNTLVLHHDGTLRQYTSGFLHAESVWELSEINCVEQSEVLAARWVTFVDAHKASLKHRSDLLASVPPTSTFLFVIYRNGVGAAVEAEVGIWVIPCPSSTTTITKKGIDAIYTHRFPDSQQWSQESGLDCFIDPKATSLTVTGAKAVVSYSLSTYKPSVSWKQNLSEGLSSVRISHSYIATSTTTSLTIHDTLFDSPQAILDLTKIGKKRKREGVPGGTRGHVKIIGYFPQPKKLITLRKNYLLAFEVKGAQTESLLINSIASGFPSLKKSRTSHEISAIEFGTVEDLSGISAQKWSALQQKLSVAADKGDAAVFEAAIFSAVQQPASVDNLSDQQVDFLLSKIFQWRDTGAASNDSRSLQPSYLQINLPAHTLLSILIERGAITPHSISQAVGPGNGFERGRLIQPGMISAALIESDKTLVLLNKYIETRAARDPMELAAVVSILVKNVLSEAFAKESTPTGQRAIEGIDNHPKSIIAQNQSDADANPHFESPNPTSTKRNLVSTLEKFAEYGEAVVTKGLRSHLKQADILALIQILRQQLFEGQHTTSLAQGAYPDRPTSSYLTLEDRVTEPVLSLHATATVLLGCIDAFGTLGFLADGEGNDFLEKLIPELKSETALTTQGLEEAAYLRGILRETLRYAESCDKDALVDANIASADGALAAVQKSGTIITLYSEASADEGDQETASGLLPLSLRADKTVSLTKTRKGGGQMKYRSLRELREMENRNKGLYSFERLVL